MSILVEELHIYWRLVAHTSSSYCSVCILCQVNQLIYSSYIIFRNLKENCGSFWKLLQANQIHGTLFKLHELHGSLSKSPASEYLFIAAWLVAFNSRLAGPVSA